MLNRVAPPPAPKREQAEPAVRAFPRMALSVEEMADELNISCPTAYKLVKQPGFPAFQIGHRTLVNRAGLQRWMDEQCAGNAA